MWIIFLYLIMANIMFDNMNLKKKIILFMTSLVIVISLTSLIYYPEKEFNKNLENYNLQVSSYAETIALGFDIALQSGDFEAVDKVLKNARKDSRTEYIAIISEGEIFTSFPKQLNLDSLKNDKGILSKESTIKNDVLTGTVTIGMNLTQLEEEYSDTQLVFVYLGIISIIVAFLLSLYLAKIVEKPIIRTKIAAESIASGNLDISLDTKLTDGTGHMMKAMEHMRDTLNSIIHEMAMLFDVQSKGDTDKFMDVDKFEGAYKTMIMKTNEIVDYHVGSVNSILTVAKKYSEGDFSQECKQFPGKQVEITHTVNLLRKNLVNILSELNELTEASQKGDLEQRGDANKFKGNFKDIISGFNQTLDAIVDPLNEADNVVKQFSDGDFTARMTGQYFGYYDSLKNNINDLGHSLEEIIIRVGEAVFTVIEISENMKTSSGELNDSSSEQEQEALTVATAVEQMAATIDDNAKNSQITSEKAENNGKIAKDGGDVVKQTVNKMKDIAGFVEQSTSMIMTLGNSSQKIGEIISVIDEIADQTNLLALNAAIEAARAGEQGRGFAVVADEVRKLAERTGDATRQIADMIKAIQSETEGVVTIMSKGNEEVLTGINFADNAGKALSQILVSSNEVLEMINQIAAANEEQSATSSEISQSINNITLSTQASTQKVSQVAGAADEMFELSNDLGELIQKFKVNKDNNSIFADRRTKLIGS